MSVTRRLTVLAATAMTVAACTAGRVGSTTTGSEPSTVRSATTSSSTTTTIPPTTTSTLVPVESWNIDPTRLVSPLEIFEAFSYQQQWLAWPEPDAEFGWASSGVSVGSSATRCRLSQWSFMGFTPTHELIHIDDSAWREDVLLATYETSRSDIVDFLEMCPGAPEFWDNNLLSAPSLTFENPRDGGEVGGVRTVQFEIGSSAEGLTIDSGSVWITEDSVPVRYEFSGKGTGDTFWELFGLPPGEDPDEQLTFDFFYELADIDGQSLMVRSPDGTMAAGPLGEIVANVPSFEPSADLAEMMTQARASECTGRSATKRIMDELGSEPDFDSISVVSQLGNTTNHIVGTIVKSTFDESFSTSSESSSKADLLAELHYNHYRVLAAYARFVGGYVELTSVSGEKHGSWDGEDLVRFDGTSDDYSFHFYVRFPDPDLQPSPGIRDEVRDAIEAWLDAAESIFADISTLHPQAIADLEAIVETSHDIEELLCIELARGWAVADEAYQTNGEAWVGENESVLMDELAAQQALLVFEYLDAIAARLSRPGVDYFRGDEASYDQSPMDGVTSDVEFVKVFASAGRDAVQWFHGWRAGTE